MPGPESKTEAREAQSTGLPSIESLSTLGRRLLAAVDLPARQDRYVGPEGLLRSPLKHIHEKLSLAAGEVLRLAERPPSFSEFLSDLKFLGRASILNPSVIPALLFISLPLNARALFHGEERDPSGQKIAWMRRLQSNLEAALPDVHCASSVDLSPWRSMLRINREIQEALASRLEGARPDFLKTCEETFRTGAAAWNGQLNEIEHASQRLLNLFERLNPDLRRLHESGRPLWGYALFQKLGELGRTLDVFVAAIRYQLECVDVSREMSAELLGQIENGSAELRGE